MNRLLKISIPLLVITALAIILILSFRSSNSASLPAPTIYSYEVINTFEHDPNAFTQGLVWENGVLYEGTGLPGQSTLRKVELETGKVLQKYELPDKFFAEGITVFENRIIQLTYRSKVGFVYDKETFEMLWEFNYPHEGWGLTHDGKNLILSDGTPTLYFLDPETFEQISTISVCDKNNSLWGINELEYIEGQIYANIWPTNRIAIIEPQTGRVTGLVDMKGLLIGQKIGRQTDVLNGIAYDPAEGRLFVTGKFWPKLYQIKLIPAK